ncbi:GL16599 [Drosophila persimilis]|uniref:GL16599 n=1 Tax=Drosophila persimilis TaxID=7234 RepID=B4GWR4_DROPE|nr:GL16599 [Drosophila persimilis]
MLQRTRQRQSEAIGNDDDDVDDGDDGDDGLLGGFQGTTNDHMTCPMDEAPEPKPKPVAKKPLAPAAGSVLIGTVAQKTEDPIVMRTCIAYEPGKVAPRYLDTVKVPRRVIDSIMLVL